MNRVRHTIDVKDLEGFRHEYSLADGPGANGERKQLLIVVEDDTLHFDVKRSDGVASTGLSTLRSAVEAYNEL